MCIQTLKHGGKILYTSNSRSWFLLGCCSVLYRLMQQNKKIHSRTEKAQSPKVQQESQFTMGRVLWRILSKPLPPTPSLLCWTTAQSQGSSPAVSQRSWTQQYLRKIALPLIIKVVLCKNQEMHRSASTSSDTMSGLCHVHKAGLAPGAFLNTAHWPWVFDSCNNMKSFYFLFSSTVKDK